MIKSRVKKIMSSSLAVIGLCIFFPMSVQASPENGWDKLGDDWYWYENGVKQGTEGRGKEIYDPESDAWYWLDSVDGGKRAVGKDLYQESAAGEWAENKENGTGKWVRYDENGQMIKGWYTNENGTYYFDLTYGTMAKGNVEIDNVSYTFDTVTGILQSGGGQNVDADAFGWVTIDGIEYWYENGVRQGTEGRGKEIYDPVSDAWYWLDAIDNGKKAVSKDVYQESQADDAGNIGKWVRYDEKGHMIKGWDTNERGTYYFDYVYGTMAKGSKEIDGKVYYFNVDTGILENRSVCNLTEDSEFYKYEYAYKTGDMSILSQEDMDFYNSLKECLDEAYKGKTVYEQELAVHDYIVLHCVYDYNNYINDTIPDVSYWAEGVFVKKRAVCSGYAEAFKLCMDILGIPCIRVSGMADGVRDWENHEWNAVQIDGEWYMVDVTFDDPVPDREGYATHTYLNVTDEMLRNDHDYNCEVAANGTKYNYYEQTYCVLDDGETFLKTAADWAAKAAVGDTTAYAVRCPLGSGTDEFMQKYVYPLAETDVMVMGRESVWRMEILNIQKCETFEQQITKAEEWAKEAKPCETVTQEVLIRYPRLEKKDMMKLYRETLSEKGILVADWKEENRFYDFASQAPVYSVKLAKECTYEEFVKAMKDWSDSAEPGEEWAVYFPENTVQTTGFQEKYLADLVPEYGVVKKDMKIVRMRADEITFVKCFEGDSADPVIAYIQKWIKEGKVSDPPLSVYVRSSNNADYSNWDLEADVRSELKNSGVTIEGSNQGTDCMRLYIIRRS